jgi:hypothetical protein
MHERGRSRTYIGIASDALGHVYVDQLASLQTESTENSETKGRIKGRIAMRSFMREDLSLCTCNRISFSGPVNKGLVQIRSSTYLQLRVRVMALGVPFAIAVVCAIAIGQRFGSGKVPDCSKTNVWHQKPHRVPGGVVGRDKAGFSVLKSHVTDDDICGIGKEGISAPRFGWMHECEPSQSQWTGFVSLNFNITQHGGTTAH